MTLTPPPQLHGTLRIILEPLLGDVPIVGALSMFFIRRPVSLGDPPPPQKKGWEPPLGHAGGLLLPKNGGGAAPPQF